MVSLNSLFFLFLLLLDFVLLLVLVNPRQVTIHTLWIFSYRHKEFPLSHQQDLNSQEWNLFIHEYVYSDSEKSPEEVSRHHHLILVSLITLVSIVTEEVPNSSCYCGKRLVAIDDYQRFDYSYQLSDLHPTMVVLLLLYSWRL